MDTLSELPVELMDLITDFLPERGSLLNLRLVCKALCAKTARSFRKAYLTTASWRIRSTSARGIFYFSNNLDVVGYLTTVILQANNFEDTWSVQGIDSMGLGTAVSRFSQLRRLDLINLRSAYGQEDSRPFFSVFY
jgi:hypothetical protein